MVEEHVTDLLPGYALGSLDEDELILVVRHLPHCPVCQEELSSYQQMLDEMPLALPLRQPPPELRNKIFRQVEQRLPQRAAKTAGRGSQSGPAAWFRSVFAHPAALAIGALVLLLLFLGYTNWSLSQQVNELQARIPPDNMRLVELEGTEDAPYAKAFLMIFSEENYGSLIVEHAPVLESGYQYQLWLIRDGQRANGGVFSVDHYGYGVMSVQSDLPLDQYGSFGVTIEPAGGSPGPTGMKVLGGDL